MYFEGLDVKGLDGYMVIYSFTNTSGGRANTISLAGKPVVPYARIIVIISELFEFCQTFSLFNNAFSLTYNFTLHKMEVIIARQN